MYLNRFKDVKPLSLPNFSFNIENTWVPLSLRKDSDDPQETQDHADLLREVFDNQKKNMLIIEGKPGSGKTSLMRRLAYEWARGEPQEVALTNDQYSVLRYDLVLYVEFRGVRNQEFKDTKINSLVLQYNEKYRGNYFKSTGMEDLNFLFNNKNCEKERILLLLDGYDESPWHHLEASYLSSETIEDPLPFHIVLTTRPGYLSEYRVPNGRAVFADVLGFTTKEQKEKYISKHFPIQETEKAKKVCSILENNENLNKLAETPLLLTLIYLLNKENKDTVDDITLLDLYCRIIRWLIDRFQQTYQDRNVPNEFEFTKTNSKKIYKTEQQKRKLLIQEHYLEFPQLHLLGKLALQNLKNDEFQESDCEEINLQLMLDAGLLKRDEFYKSSDLQVIFSFPHRTIKEFLAAFYCFISHENTDRTFPLKAEMNTDKMEEFDKFLLRIALSKQIPINTAKRKIFFETITELTLDLTLDAINTTIGLNNELLKWFISQCTNIRILQFNKESYEEKEPQISVQILLSFSDLIHLNSLTFHNCIFEADSKISFTNCPSLKTLEFKWCKIRSSATIDFSKLPALDTLKFDEQCKIDLEAWQSITDEITRSSVKQLKLSFRDDFNNKFLNHLQKCNNVEKIKLTAYDISEDSLLSLKDLIRLHSLTFNKCVIAANSQISFTNSPSLKKMEFWKCEIESSASVDFSKLPALNILEFHHSTIEADSKISCTNCPSLKTLEFNECDIRSSAILDFSKLRCLELTPHQP